MLRVFCLAALFAAPLLSSCAHGPNKGDPDSARSTAELFHHRTRWKDYGGAARLLVPEKRAAFDEARRTLHDERDLTISDYQLDELEVLEDGTARVVSRLSWYRLPSISAHEDTVVTTLVYLEGRWFVAGQTGGPFEDSLTGSVSGSAPPPAASAR